MIKIAISRFFLLALSIVCISSIANAETDVVALSNAEREQLATNFWDCYQAYRSNPTREPTRPANCREVAANAALVARFCSSRLGREGENSFYRQNYDLCHKAADLNGHIIRSNFEQESWQEQVRGRVQGIRDGAFEQIRNLPLVGPLIRLVPGCDYSIEEDVSEPLPEGVMLPHGVSRRDVPGVTANCQF